MGKRDGLEYGADGGDGPEEFRADELRVDEFRVDEFRVDEFRVDEFRVDEFRVDEFRVDEFRVDEFRVDEFRVDEFRVDEFRVDERTFRELGERSRYSLRGETYRMAREGLSFSAEAVGEVRGTLAYAVEDVHRHLASVLAGDLAEAVESRDYERFEGLVKEIGETDRRFAGTVRQDGGFVGVEGYGGPPDFPAGYGRTSVESGQSFLEEVKTLLDGMDPARGEMEPVDCRVARSLVETAEGSLDKLRRADWEDGDPYDVKREQGEEHVAMMMHALRRLLRPRVDGSADWVGGYGEGE